MNATPHNYFSVSGLSAMQQPTATASMSSCISFSALSLLRKLAKTTPALGLLATNWEDDVAARAVKPLEIKNANKTNPGRRAQMTQDFTKKNKPTSHLKIR